MSKTMESIQLAETRHDDLELPVVPDEPCKVVLKRRTDMEAFVLLADKLARIEALCREFSDGHIGSTVGAVCRKVLAIIKGRE